MKAFPSEMFLIKTFPAKTFPVKSFPVKTFLKRILMTIPQATENRNFSKKPFPGLKSLLHPDFRRL